MNVFKKEINLIKNNAGRNCDGVECLQEFFDFLLGQVPEGLNFRRGHVPKMSPKKAFSIIYYLQEYLSVFPDNIEMCWYCGRLYWQARGRNYCGDCEYLVPVNYDRGLR